MVTVFESHLTFLFNFIDQEETQAIEAFTKEQIDKEVIENQIQEEKSPSVVQNIEKDLDKDDSSGEDEGAQSCDSACHLSSVWEDFENISLPAYIKPSGKYYKKSCNVCSWLLVNKNNEKDKGTLLNGNNPAKGCKACSDFIVCNTCYLKFLNTLPDRNNKRRRRINAKQG